MNKVKKGDQVVVIAGKYKGKKGEVLRVFQANTVMVKGINLIKRSVKKSKEYPNGGYIEKEAPINISNVMVFCSKCGTAVRVGFDVDANGNKTRQCKKCGQKFE